MDNEEEQFCWKYFLLPLKIVLHKNKGILGFTPTTPKRLRRLHTLLWNDGMRKLFEEKCEMSVGGDKHKWNTKIFNFLNNKEGLQ